MVLFNKALFCFIHTSKPEFISALTFCFSGNLLLMVENSHALNSVYQPMRIRQPMLSFEVGHMVSNLFG
ncbi:hypothetical protein NC653_016300 [Populus alba x Populus x berolinensis]|uniref:Uncharacterized protein n=1 Tax=Populus alba x Populus x berolinensis TaxID=444605 RepID=A0AAD6VZ83_9ROSI|nr:hypothetical protein NC653_016300 [Populus alba x Populus x berolinensis]